MKNYEYFVDYYDDLPEYSEYSRIAHQVYQTDNWEEVPPEIRLQHLGFHRISLDVFPSSSSNDVDFNIDFNFEATGSQSSSPHFMVTLVENNYGAISYHKIIEDSQISDQAEAVQVKNEQSVGFDCWCLVGNGTGILSRDLSLSIQSKLYIN